jgi:hypothetical protein
MIRHLAPTAPGRLGERLDPAEVQVYIDQLQTWVLDRRHELDELDAAALASKQQSSVTSDLTLSMALWKAISDRLRLILATWDGGRVLAQERERLSVLIWGRLDASLDPGALAASGQAGSGAAALAVSLPEACRISDALAGQLRVRLARSTPPPTRYARRLKALRAQLERLRDQVRPRAQPSARGAAGRSQRSPDWQLRTDDLVGLASTGAATSAACIGPLENDAARLERDLIVGGVKRRRTRRRRPRPHASRPSDAATNSPRRQARPRRPSPAQAVAAVDPSPNYAVPDVDALGPVPTSAGEIAAYRGRLERVTSRDRHRPGRVCRGPPRARRPPRGAGRVPDDGRSRGGRIDARCPLGGSAGDRPARTLAVTGPGGKAAVDLHRAWVAWWSSPGGERTARRLGLGKDTA